jgi:hypothetical protein
VSFHLLRRPSRRASVITALLSVAVLVPTVAVAVTGDGQSPTGTPARVAAPQQLPKTGGELIAVVGDIACAPSNPVYRGAEGNPAGCREKTVAELLAGQRLAAFLPLGDLQYEDGTFDEFTNVYDQFFGQYKAITRPVPGNHEYKTAGGRGYYDYFGGIARESNPFGAVGSYSYNIGSWHLIAVNSTQCSPITSCGEGSAMMRWLQDDLAKNPTKCTIAYWHHPLWSSGHHGEYAPMTPVWNTLLDGGVDVVFTSHEHNYQRFSPLGRATPITDTTMAPPVTVAENEGMRAWVVGTGGANNYALATDEERPELVDVIESKNAGSAIGLFGVLFLRLGEGRYEWNFAEAEPKPVGFADSGVGTCH